MKKLIIAAVIVFTSGVTAWSVTKKSGDATTSEIKASINKGDFSAKSYTGSKSDVASIQ